MQNRATFTVEVISPDGATRVVELAISELIRMLRSSPTRTKAFWRGKAALTTDHGAVRIVSVNSVRY